MVAVYVIILGGGLIVTARVDMLPASIAFWLTFASGTAVLARRDHCFTARWHVGPVCGGSFWGTLVTSPEVLIFLFFMITDPKTAPLGRIGRVVYGALIGYIATVLIATQSTEFGTKVALLGALVVVCALRPVLELLTPATDDDDHLLRWIGWRRIRASRGMGAGALSLLLAFGVLCAMPHGRTVDTAAAQISVVVDTTQSSSELDIVIPPVAIAPATRQLSNPITEAQAQAMARDLMVALRNAESVPMYRFERLTVVVMRESRSSQAKPTVAVRAEGVVAATGEPADRTYAMFDANGQYLLDGEYDTASVFLD
jgi:hypothetical protein